MIINNFNIIKENNWTKIIADVAWGKASRETICFAVPNDYSTELDINCADNFLVGLMLVAIKLDENIYIKGSSVSKTLVDNINNILIPALTKMGCGTGKTKIFSEFVINENFQRGNCGATGISLGVDSFYSILRYLDDDKNPIDTVLYVHRINNTNIIIDEKMEHIFNIRNNAADKLSLKFIPVLTNLNTVLDSEFVFSQYHTFRNLAVAITLKSLSYYYYATGYSIDEMKLCINDSAYYDNIISQTLNYNGFSMKMSGENVTRFEKTELISNNKVVQEFLDVCLDVYNYNNRKIVNCSTCHKCTRTLATLDVLGIISEFDKTFDLNLYKKNRYKAWGELLYRMLIMNDEFALEIFQKAKIFKFKLPPLRWVEFFRIGIYNQKNKIKNRIFK